MYNNGDVCPICGDGKLIEKVKDKVVKYKGNSLTLHGFTVYECDCCEESLVCKSTMKSSEKLVRDFQRKIDGLLTSEEIKKIRESLGFTQEVFAHVLGVGLKNFARYENGTVTQSRTADHLLRILFEKPETLQIINKEAAKGVPLQKVVDNVGGTFYNPSHAADREIKYRVSY